MKKIKCFLCVGMAILMILALAACGGDGGSSGNAVTEVGTWEKSEIVYQTIEQGKLNTIRASMISLRSDNTFTLVFINNAYYSSDGGETYTPVSDVDFIVYGKYETVEVNEEIGDQTIKFTEFTRVVSGEFDSDTDASDAKKEIMKNSDAIRSEIILTSDHKISDYINLGSLFAVVMPDN